MHRRSAPSTLRPGRLRRVLAAAALLVVVALAFSLAAARRNGGQRLPQRAAVGVRLGNHDVGGQPVADIRALLERLAPRMRTAPVEPRYDANTRGLVPGLDGAALDVDATLNAVLQAAPKASVPYVFRAVHPSRTLADLPLAPIYRGNPDKQAVAIEINVAWGNEYIPPLLDVLRRHRAKATWFLMGDWAEANPSLARQIAAQGNEIASHGWSAAEWSGLGRAQMVAQISQADAAIKQATGVRPFWFSTHKGVVNPQILKVSRELGHETVMWTADTVDWMKPSVDQMVSRVLKRAVPGALILMHPTERTPAALDKILDGVAAKGLRVVTVGQLLSPERLSEAK